MLGGSHHPSSSEDTTANGIAAGENPLHGQDENPDVGLSFRGMAALANTNYCQNAGTT